MKKQSSYLALIIILLGACGFKTIYTIGSDKVHLQNDLFRYVSENISKDPQTFARGIKGIIHHYKPVKPSYFRLFFNFGKQPETNPYDLSQTRDKDGNTLAHAGARSVIDFYQHKDISVLGPEGFALSKNVLANLKTLNRGYSVDLNAENKAGETPILILTGNGSRMLLASLTIRLAGADCDPRCREKFFDYYSQKALKAYFDYMGSGTIVN